MAHVFHPKAAEHIDKRGDDLLSRVVCLLKPRDQPATRRQQSPDPRFVDFTIGPNDLRGPREETQKDKNGNEISRAAYYASGALVLHEETFKEYADLAHSVHRTPAFQNRVSANAIRDWIWEWIKADASAARVPLSEFLVTRADEKVKRRSYVVPVHQVTCSVAFRLGNVVLRPINRAQLEELDAFELALTPERERERLAATQRKRRHDMQGYLSCLIEAEAEPDMGRRRAIEESENSVAVLRLASVGIVTARGRSFCTVLGQEALQSRTTFQIINGRLRPDSGHLVSDSLPFWHLKPALLKNAILPLLTPWDQLLRLVGARTEFQESALKAALMLSRAAVQDRLGDKLLFCFVAAESLLLRSDSESITASIADRMAFLVEDDPTRRMEKVKLVRDVYGYRSRYIHHAQELDASAAELDRIDQFLIHAMLALRQAAVISLRGNTREEMLSQLDAKKYA